MLGLVVRQAHHERILKTPFALSLSKGSRWSVSLAQVRQAGPQGKVIAAGAVPSPPA